MTKDQNNNNLLTTDVVRRKNKSKANLLLPTSGGGRNREESDNTSLTVHTDKNTTPTVSKSDLKQKALTINHVALSAQEQALYYLSNLQQCESASTKDRMKAAKAILNYKPAGVSIGHDEGGHQGHNVNLFLDSFRANSIEGTDLFPTELDKPIGTRPTSKGPTRTKFPEDFEGNNDEIEEDHFLLTSEGDED